MNDKRNIEIASRIGLIIPGPRKRKCLIIGGSPSSIGCAKGWYIDGFDGDVIRINQPCIPDQIYDLGARTDILFTSRWMDKNVYNSRMCRKVVIEMDDTRSISDEFYGKGYMFLTTGMLCIILCLSIYDVVELIGFGDCSRRNSDAYISTHLDPRVLVEKSPQCPHDIDMEHKVLESMIKGEFSGKVIVLDSDMARPMSSCIWDRFKRKTLISYTGHKFDRVPSLMHELRRVGMSGVDVVWQFPDKIGRSVLDSVGHIKDIEHGGYFNCTMGQYRAICTAYHLGCSEALFMEDDIRFIRDVDKVSDIVESMPRDYDICLLDCFYRDDPSEYRACRDNRMVNDNWSEFDRMYATSCYAVSRAGMERLIGCYESACGPDEVLPLRNCDHYLDRSLLGDDSRLYFSRRNACIQRGMGSCSTDYGNIERRYINMGIDFSMYSEA